MNMSLAAKIQTLKKQQQALNLPIIQKQQQAQNLPIIYSNDPPSYF